MKKKAFLAISALAALGYLSSGPANAASFDCSRNLPSDFRMICRNPTLSRMDDKAADLYDRVSQRLGRQGQSVLKAQRLGFLQRRGACDGDPRCVRMAYQDQISALQSMLGNGGGRNQGMKTLGSSW